MADKFTETSHQGWFGRIGSAIKGVAVGAVLFVLAFPLLFWNEGRAVKTYKTLKEGAGAVVSVPADNLAAAEDAALVHMTGKANTDMTLKDDVFGVSSQALKLRRSVEMYQWKEEKNSQTKRNAGGSSDTTTTYTYSRDWSDSPIDSSDFKEPNGHENPKTFAYESATQTAAPITIGAYTLSSSLAGKLNNFEPLTIPSTEPLPAALMNKGIKADEGFFIGNSLATPEIGDLRIRFSVAPIGDVSLIARKIGNTFEPYTASTGKSIEMIKAGVFTADAMFQAAQDQNKMITWLLRFAGFIVMFIGMALILNPLKILADVIPFIGSIVGAGTAIIAGLCAAVLSLITVAVAWLFYRPLLSIVLIAIAALVITLIVKKVRKGRVAVKA